MASGYLDAALSHLSFTRARTRALVSFSPPVMARALGALCLLAFTGSAGAQVPNPDPSANPNALPLAPAEEPPRTGAWRVRPQLEVSERFSDNLALSPKKDSGFVTKITPGVRVQRFGSRFELYADYGLENIFYHGIDRNSVTNNKLKANFAAELLNPWFYLDGEALIQRSASSLLGTFGVDETTAGGFSDLSLVSLTPKFRYRHGNSWSGEASLRTSYVDSSSNALSNSVGNRVNIGVNSGSAFNTVGWSANYTGEAISYQSNNEETSNRFDAGVSYRVRPKLRLLGNVGYEAIESDSVSEDLGGASWSVGALWQPTVRSSFQATAGHRFFGTSYGLKLNHRTRRTFWNLSYDESVTSSRSQIELFGDLRRQAETIFKGVEDPEERAQAIDDFVRQLTDQNVLFTNQIFLQKRLQGSFMWELYKNTFILSAFNSTRDVDAVGGRRSIVFGNSDFNISRVIRQSGASATWAWRFMPRTSTVSTLSTDLTEFTDIDREDRQSLLSFGVLHQLSRYAAGIAELRHQRRNSNAGIDFNENSLEVGLQISY
jgi:uncharacterized protein (PEP-CTERM system associated)